MLHRCCSRIVRSFYALDNNEYPVRPGVAPSDVVKAWGELKADDVPLTAIAENAAKARVLIDKVGFDQGPGS